MAKLNILISSFKCWQLLKMKATIVVVLILVALSVAKKSYEGYAVFRMTPKTELGKEFIAELVENKEFGQHLDFWRVSHTLSDPTDVMVPPRFIRQVEDFFHKKKMEFTILVKNVEDLIQPSAECSLDFSNPAFYDCYHTMEEIEKWMDKLSALQPDLVSKVIVSSTFEGKDVSALKISSDEGHPAVIFQGGIHAREWISPATMMNFARWFVEGYNENDDNVTQILNSYDIYIVPVLNKDGYEYSWNRDRLWRKNRNTNDGTWGPCVGVDLNRNWNVGFGGPGAYDWKCLELYHGRAGLSEPETRGMDEFARGLQESQGVHVFIDFHSYGQYWMWPWGYETCLPPTPDAAMQRAGCMAATTALTGVYGTPYYTHPSAEMYAASGATEDWAYHTLGAKYSYIVELRPRDANVGFLLPDSQIEPTSVETFEGVKALLLYAKEDQHPIAQKVDPLPQPLNPCPTEEL